jgi:putative membrane protein
MLAAGLCGLFVAYSLAQPGQPGQPVEPRQPGQIDRPTTTPTPTRPGQPSQQPAYSQVPQVSDVDRFLASCLLAKNQAEIEISQFAQQRSQNPQVKQFAQDLINDHRQAVQKLQQITGTPAMGRTNQSEIDDRRVNQPQPPGTPGNVAGQPDRVAGATNPPQGNAVDQLIAIDQQIVNRATSNLREKLQEKTAGDFDECYLAAQVACHMQMASALEVIERRASGQLRQIAAEAQPTVAQHLQKAEQLLAQQTGMANRRVGMDREPTQQPERIPR